jgi:hypothetical protein
MSYNNNTKAKAYLQSLKNEVNYDSEEKRRHWQSTWNVDIDPHDKTRLQNYMNQELSFYNSLVESFTSRLRGQPETINLLIGDWEKIFSICCELSFNVEKLRNANENAELPKQLEPFRNILLGRDENKKRHLTELFIVMLEVCSAPGNIHPLTRRYMSLEVLRFYREQAKNAMQEIKVLGMDGTSYKNSFLNLEKFDNTRKRHLQIPKEIIKYNYDSVKKILKILTPYNSVPIEIPGFNNIDEKPWNVLVIHQQPGKVANHLTPWVVEFKNVPTLYLLKLVEVSNPYLSSAKFRACKMK